MFVNELPVAVDAVVGDAEDVDTRCEREEVPFVEGTQLLGADRREVLRVEREDDGSVLEVVGELVLGYLLAVGAEKLEIGGVVPF